MERGQTSPPVASARLEIDHLSIEGVPGVRPERLQQAIQREFTRMAEMETRLFDGRRSILVNTCKATLAHTPGVATETTLARAIVGQVKERLPR